MITGLSSRWSAFSKRFRLTIPLGRCACEVGGMRTGISIILTPSERLHLETVAHNRNMAQKHLWWAVILLLSTIGVGTLSANS
jgi:hypothetical protein